MPRPLTLCQCQSCQKLAVYVTEWRTPVMPAPSFWYDCEDDIAKTRRALAKNPTVIATERRIND